MARVSMGDVWDDAKAFVTREAGLLLPLGLATFGLAWVILMLAMPAAADPATMAKGDVPAGLLLVMLPVLLLVLVGQLAVSLMVVTSRASVGEALRGAVQRVPGALLASFVGGLAVIAVLLAVIVVAMIVTTVTGGGLAQIVALVKVLATPGMLWLAVRLTPLIPLIAASSPTLQVVPLIRTALALTRGQSVAIAGATLIFLVGYTLIVMATEFAGGTLLVLAGRAVSAPPAVAATLVAVLVSLVWAILQTAWMVFQAMLYRRLAARS